MKLAILNFKGGVGKSLIAHQLITSFEYKGIEIDPYGSLADRLPDNVMRADIKDKKLPKLEDENIIYDFGGFDDLKLDLAVKESDLIIIPFLATLEVVHGTLQTLNRVKKFNKPILLIANMVQKEQDVIDSKLAFEEELGFEIEVFTLNFSIALQTAINENKSIIELSRQGGIKGFAYRKASKTIENLHNKILEYKV